MENRNRRVKFEEIAEKRVNEAIKRIRLLGKLSNKSNYDYTDAHVAEIFKALDEEIKNTKSRFQAVESDEPEFKFKKANTSK